MYQFYASLVIFVKKDVFSSSDNKLEKGLPLTQCGRECFSSYFPSKQAGANFSSQGKGAPSTSVFDPERVCVWACGWQTMASISKHVTSLHAILWSWDLYSRSSVVLLMPY